MSTYLTDAIGWTIIHSLWQGLAIGLIVFLILRIRRESTPQFKYLVGIFALAAILASSFITFLFEYQPVPGISGQLPSSLIGAGWVGQLSNPAEETGPEEWNVRFPAFRETISASFHWMTSLWLLGVLILSFRLSGGLILVSRLRTREISPLPARWEERLGILVRKSGIRRALRFVQSGKVKVPTVIGILRPMVLVPAGIISLMPVEQLESILAHEIAHIRRYDFLVNIFQSFVEALFFYHPVVWMLSESVRREREKCCDDFAVAICGKLSIYARALTGLSELQARVILPSVALTGRRNRIIHRVERLINTKKMKTNATEKIVAGLVILCSALIVTLSTGASLSSMKYQPGASLQIGLQAYEKNRAEIPEDREPALPAEPALKSHHEIPAEPSITSLPGSLSPPDVPDQPEPARQLRTDTAHRHEHINMDVKDNVVIREFVNKDGVEQSIKFVIRKGQVKELYVNGEEIPESEFPEYKKEIDRTMRDLREMDRDLREARRELGVVDWEEIRRDIEAGMEHFRQHDMPEFQEQMKQFQMNRIDMQLDHEKMQEDIRKAMKELENIDLSGIEHNIQESMKHLGMERFHIDEEMIKIDELIDEIEKLELEEK